jgi:hypothetical protein
MTKKQIKLKVEKLKDAIIRAMLINVPDDEHIAFIQIAIDNDAHLREADDDSIHDIFEKMVWEEFTRIEDNDDREFYYDIADFICNKIEGNSRDQLRYYLNRGH